MGADIIYEVLRALDHRLSFIKGQSAFVMIVYADENHIAELQVPVALRDLQGSPFQELW